MVPDPTAIVPALGCLGCKRIIPMSGVRVAKADRKDVNRALRAARRRRMREAG